MTVAEQSITAEQLRLAILEKLFCMQAKFPEVATRQDFYMALSYVVRDLLLRRWIDTAHTYFIKEKRTVVYLSAEFLIGPQLGANIINLGIYNEVHAAVEELDLRLEDLLEQEEEPGLGNGGLGRLAACYMESLATLAIPAIGYGIRYEFGIFDQEIINGAQVEKTDKWLRVGNPWEIARPQVAFNVKLGGYTEKYIDAQGIERSRWVPQRVVKGVSYDTPVVGYGVHNVNMLRLWKSEATESFDFDAFNVGDYYGAVDQKIASENLTKVLYPNDEPVSGKILRLEQQYFFVTCSLQDMIRLYMQRRKTFDDFPHKFVIQLNDTHPALGVAELMRLLVDEHKVEWTKAWDITRQTFAYTNHTLLPEALETWPLDLFKSVLPRHVEIIYEINHRFLEEVRRRFPGDDDRVERLSLIGEGNGKRVRMANLACVGSQAINGVAALHSDLLKKTVLKDFYELWPEKFSNKTNGVTPRRFMALANPGLTKLLNRTIGDKWLSDLDQLRQLEALADDPAFRSEWRRVKRANKAAFAASIKAETGLTVDPDSLFDVQAKRIHEYKRQHLNVLHIITLYSRLLRDPHSYYPPRTFIFGGKAAPGYYIAKSMIKLINSVGSVVNNDPAVNDRLKVVFFPNFNVKNGQQFYASADLSEQISTAGKEASGTGNMKFALNGALTIGTLDGANVEIREEVGADNFFLFGLTVEEIQQRRADGYRPADILAGDEELAHAVYMIADGAFSNGDRNEFAPLVNSLIQRDDYMLFADYRSYIERQKQVSEVYSDEDRWTLMSILNVARMGRFSSDRAIREYCLDIWKAEPTEVIAGHTSALRKSKLIT